MVAVYTLNAFSDTVSGGNPAGVVADASSLSEAQMQKIASDLGYSETAFVQPSLVANFHVRFFTPVSEVDLCGHATIANFSLLHHLKKVRVGKCTQETRAGVLEIEIFDTGKVFMTQSDPVFGDYLDKALIASTLNEDVKSLHSELSPQIVSTGLRDVMVPVRDLKTLHAIRPNFDAISQLSKRLDVVGYHLFALDTLHGATAHCRNFAPLYDIPEEAATGTASGALSCYLFTHKLVDEDNAKYLEFEQGYSMDRPSRIESKLLVVNREIKKVEVGGRAYIVSGPKTHSLSGQDLLKN